MIRPLLVTIPTQTGKQLCAHHTVAWGTAALRRCKELCTPFQPSGPGEPPAPTVHNPSPQKHQNNNLVFFLATSDARARARPTKLQCQLIA
eukprot:CAMPEP_0175840920 /NCGR_PEP_ID=MMETSP0107_2-20121207/19636_1 /TAXON_ID=195067 ORGANISM="Goniomonas pacifica, Strain CCMP1869" /NCGR_SAMPLE_ID=MMETSP0107_2 /ASSEMBLY_ACC=CAM_ASM_000203 /LENGTH=90 /DNA_ID=CAMNT_0017154819 /DNA_START=103 /DNA_END=371 /DNA_ORIENTATION=+